MAELPKETFDGLGFACQAAKDVSDLGVASDTLPKANCSRFPRYRLRKGDGPSQRLALILLSIGEGLKILSLDINPTPKEG